MDTDLQNDVVREPSFFRSPTFLAGMVLWLAVLGALAGVWYQQRLKLEQTPTKPSVVAEQSAEQDGSPKSIIIKTNKDGSLTIDDSGKPPSASPWDEDGIADFEFIDTEGRPVTKADLLGKPWIVCFVFTHCAATCPMVTSSMRELQDRLKDYDFRLVTLTVDPERDTPEVLKGYGESRGADFSKWMFLGGDQRAIYKLIQGSFKMPVQETLGKDRQPGFEFIHSNNIMLVDTEGIVQGKFDATKGEAMSALRREIQKLAKPLTEKAEQNDEENKN
ncbi:MAG: SCO family protein [Candidatus Saccharimonas sp.]|nr:SCO family protein [Planctomycetaceae bacterium]